MLDLTNYYGGLNIYEILGRREELLEETMRQRYAALPAPDPKTGRRKSGTAGPSNLPAPAVVFGNLLRSRFIGRLKLLVVSQISDAVQEHTMWYGDRDESDDLDLWDRKLDASVIKVFSDYEQSIRSDWYEKNFRNPSGVAMPGGIESLAQKFGLELYEVDVLPQLPAVLAEIGLTAQDLAGMENKKAAELLVQYKDNPNAPSRLTTPIGLATEIDIITDDDMRVKLERDSIVDGCRKALIGLRSTFELMGMDGPSDDLYDVIGAAISDDPGRYNNSLYYDLMLAHRDALKSWADSLDAKLVPDRVAWFVDLIYAKDWSVESHEIPMVPVPLVTVTAPRKESIAARPHKITSVRINADAESDATGAPSVIAVCDMTVLIGQILDNNVKTQELAKVLGVSASTVSNYVNGKARWAPKDDVKIALVRYLGMKIDVFDRVINELGFQPLPSPTRRFRGHIDPEEIAGLANRAFDRIAETSGEVS